MRLTRFIVLLLVGLVATGCVNSEMGTPKSGESAFSIGEKYGEKEGYLFLVLTMVDGVVDKWNGEYDKDRRGVNLSYKLKYQGTNENIVSQAGEIDQPMVFLSGYELDFKPSYGKSRIYLIPLPEGEYEINDYEFVLGASYNEKKWWAESDFIIPFRIERKTVTYLGEWRAFQLRDKGPWTAFLKAGAYWTNVDRSERDLEQLYRKHPYLEGLPVYKLISSDALFDYFKLKDPIQNIDK